jgi:hypothetical protein
MPLDSSDGILTGQIVYAHGGRNAFSSGLGLGSYLGSSRRPYQNHLHDLHQSAQRPQLGFLPSAVASAGSHPHVFTNPRWTSGQGLLNPEGFYRGFRMANPTTDLRIDYHRT